MFESAFFRGLRRAALASGGSAIVLLCAPPQSALAVPGEQNALPEACQAVAGATYVANEASGIVLKPPLDFPTSAGAYAANWALRLCPPQIAAPPDRTGADGFDPDAVTATSDDPELANPAADDPNCYASIPQTITKAEYSDFLGIESFPSGWGVLGTPTVRHFNTDADVRLYGGAPADNPDTPGNESLADERKTVRDASGREVLKLPVGKNGLTYRADTLVSVLDFPFIYIPGVPSESKPFKELVKSSGGSGPSPSRATSSSMAPSTRSRARPRSMRSMKPSASSSGTASSACSTTSTTRTARMSGSTISSRPR